MEIEVTDRERDDAPAPPIAITGMHRSGTSMITRGLHESGLHLIGGDADVLLAAADDNPEGFWENKAVVACNDDLLEAVGGAWDLPPTDLPARADDPRLLHVVDAAIAALDGLRENPHWGFKDPRTCLTAGFWLDLEPDLHFVLCVRHPLEVALSLKRRNQNSYGLGLALWERYYTAALATIPAERRIVTHYDAFFVDAAAELGRVAEFAGLTAAAPRVRDDLRHHDVRLHLDEVNVSDEVIGLYAALCDEAGVEVPAPGPGEPGRVRRLVLDGTVAARHAEQRQRAIERLEERLAESRRNERAALEEQATLRREVTDLRRTRDELERNRAHLTAERDALLATQRQHLDQLRDLTDTIATLQHEARETATSLRSTDARLSEIENHTARLVRAADRVRHRATGGATGARVRRQAGRVKIAADDGQLLNRIVELPGKVNRRLPPSAQSVTARGAQFADEVGAGAAAGRATRAIYRRLPPRLRRRVDPMISGGATACEDEARSEPIAPEEATAPDTAPFHLWRPAFERMIADHLPDGVDAVIIATGMPDGITTIGAHSFAPLAPDEVTDDQALIAALEGARAAGRTHLIVPEGARVWFERRPEFAGHVRGQHGTADIDGAGMVFDLTSAPAAHQTDTVLRVATQLLGPGVAAAVLDWTDLDLAAELPGHTTFRPPSPEHLPYADASIDLAVVTEQQDHDEAIRVATAGVITVRRAGDRIEVLDVHVGPNADAPTRTPATVLLSGEAPIALLERIEAEGHRTAASDADVTTEVVVLLAPGVLPLPGAIDALVDSVRVAEPDVAFAAKAIGTDGRLLAAGGEIFDDGSTALVGRDSPEVRAPWHEFVRPVTWAPAMVAVRADQLGPEGERDLLAWSAHHRAGGGRIVYQPLAATVALEPLPDRTVGPEWHLQLSRRPRRPDVLSDGAWRYLVAHHDGED